MVDEAVAMTPREKAEEIVRSMRVIFDADEPEDSWLIPTITTALQQAADEQLERDRARIAELEAEVKALSAIQTHLYDFHHCNCESMPTGFWERMS